VTMQTPSTEWPLQFARYAEHHKTMRDLSELIYNVSFREKQIEDKSIPYSRFRGNCYFIATVPKLALYTTTKLYCLIADGYQW